MPSSLVKALILLFSTLVLLLTVTAGLLWALTGTEAGTRLLAEQARSWSGDSLHWNDIRGTLLGPLQLQGVRFKQAELAIELQTLTLDWRPGALLSGRLQIDQLEAEGILIETSGDEQSAPPTAPFKPAELPLPLDIQLQALQIRKLQLKIDDQPVQLISLIQLEALLEQRQLTLQRLVLRTPEGGLAASGSVDLKNLMPLNLELQWDWQLPQVDQSGPVPATANGSPLAGELGLSGNLDWQGPLAFDLRYRALIDQLTGLQPDLPERLEALGRLLGEFQGEDLSLEQVTLAMQEMPLQLDLRGKLQLPAAGEPVFDGQLEWKDLQWPLTGAEPELASPRGRLDLAGTTGAYELKLAVSLAGSQIPPGDWQGSGSGNLSELQLHQLHGRLLGGELHLSGPLGWEPVPTWALRIEGSDLDPGQWLPDYPGQLTFSLHSDGRIEPDRGPVAAIALQQLSGELANYAFKLSASAELAGEDLDLQALQLDSGGNRLSASGQLSAGLLAMEWQLQAPNPGTLLPGAEGRLRATGRVEGSPDEPRLQARLQGDNLRLDNYSLPHLEAELQAGLGAADPLRLDLELGPLRDGDQLLLQATRLQARGTQSKHRLDLSLQGPAEQLEARLEGGLDQALTTWTGDLSRLSAESGDYGAWQLVQRTPLTLSATGLLLGDACLQAAPGAARVCARGDWTQTGGGSLAARLLAMPVNRLLPNLGGELSGELKAELAGDGALRARAAFNMSPGQIRVELEQGVRELAHGGGELDLTIGARGLDGKLKFDAPEQGIIQAELQLPAFSQFPLPASQPLAGRIRAELPDLSGLPAWVPELAASGGRLDANLRLAGTLDQPGILGEFALTEGVADIPLAGLQLRQIELRAASDPDEPGQLAVTGGLVSGPGRIDLEGRLELPGNALEMSLKGDRLQIYNTADARAVASPDLQISWRDDVLRLRGQILIPEAEITPKLGLSPGLLTDDPATTEVPGRIISPSPDVVVLDPGGAPVERPQTVSPVRLDNQIQLVLGEHVNVNALGFISRITGNVTFTNDPGSRELLPLAQGRLSVEDGTFRAFGQDLDIETGQLIFSGVPVTEPELNVRAVRWIDSNPQVSAAGVLITGAASEPSLELFSRPQLEATEIQSYLLTGRPPGSPDNVLNIGTYLHPRFYVGYGYNLLEKTSEFNSLYTITPRYGVGANVGEADNNLNLTITHEH